MTTRRWMAAMVGVAILSWLGGAALHVWYDTRTAWVFHVWERRGSHDPGAIFGTQHRVTFWPRYWRRLFGMPWPGTFICDHGDDDNIKWARIAVTMPVATEEIGEPLWRYSRKRLPDSYFANRAIAAYSRNYVPLHWKKDEDGFWESDY